MFVSYNKDNQIVSVSTAKVELEGVKIIEVEETDMKNILENYHISDDKLLKN